MEAKRVLQQIVKDYSLKPLSYLVPMFNPKQQRESALKTQRKGAIILIFLLYYEYLIFVNKNKNKHF